MRNLLLFLMGAASACASSAAFAQDDAGQASDPAARRSDGGVEEIVVTAQRREQSLLAVPLSVTAVSGERLNDTGLTTVGELQYITPGLFSNTGTGYTQLFVRGIGNNIFVGADPSVATYIDDVPRIYGTMVDNLINVERVEVLKGAQGGLYGRNATGGVVNIVTRQPSPDGFEGNALLSYGEKETLRIAGYLNIPLGSRVALNISGERATRDYYVKTLRANQGYTPAMFPVDGTPGTLGGINVNPYGTPEQTAALFNRFINVPEGSEDQDFWAIDSKLRIEFSDSLTVTLAGDYSDKRDSSGVGWTNLDFGAQKNSLLNVFFPYIAGIYQTCGDFACAATNIPDDFFPSEYRKFTNFAANPSQAYLEDYGGSVTAVLSLDGFEINNVAALRGQHTFFANDSSSISVPMVVPYVDNDKWFFYNELRISTTGDGPFRFMGGATYLTNHFKSTNSVVFFNVLDPAYPQFGSTSETQVETEVKNWSIFAEVGYELTDALTLSASGRYIRETNSTDFILPLPSSLEVSASRFLPSVTLSYRLASGGNVYARYAKGFKAGGVNPLANPAVTGTTLGAVFGPEDVNTYEVGLRTTLFDGMAQFTSAIFYNDYTGLQAQTAGNVDNPQIQLAIVNAGSARTYGAEASLAARVADPLTISLNAGYLNARYKDFRNTDGTVLTLFDFSGTRMIYAPEWQLGFTADLDQPLNDRFQLIGSTLISYTDDVLLGQSVAPGVPDPLQEGYWLANARLGVKTADDKYQLAVFANNIFNKGYFTSGIPTVLGNGLIWGRPRIVGVEARVNF